jgi:hypothetical protein
VRVRAAHRLKLTTARNPALGGGIGIADIAFSLLMAISGYIGARIVEKIAALVG